MNWVWIDLVAERPESATLAATATFAGGEPAGWLAAWRRQGRPTHTALRAWDAILDPEGAPATISLVRAPDGVRLKFDDLAVQQARRVVLQLRPSDLVTTLLSDASHFEGSILGARGPDAPRRARDDPFARIFPELVLDIGGGMLGSVAPPAGPTIERYGSDQPWPSDRFG